MTWYCVICLQLGREIPATTWRNGSTLCSSCGSDGLIPPNYKDRNKTKRT